MKVRIEGSAFPIRVTLAITAGGIGSTTHWCQTIVWPVSKVRNMWPPDKIPKLPSKIVALVNGAILLRGSTFSATWPYDPHLKQRSSACRRQIVIISPGVKCFIPPFHGNPLTNFTIWSTTQTTIMPGTGKESGPSPWESVCSAQWVHSALKLLTNSVWAV